MKIIFKLGVIMNKNYKTKQKDIILRIIKEKKQFTIKDIYQEVCGEVGLTTIYRLVDKLVNEGIINKYFTKDNTVYYQYLEKCSRYNHFYLKCDICGDMIHIDCDCISDLSCHILEEHNFIPNRENIIIGGICNKCSEENSVC